MPCAPFVSLVGRLLSLGAPLRATPAGSFHPVYLGDVFGLTRMGKAGGELATASETNVDAKPLAVTMNESLSKRKNMVIGSLSYVNSAVQSGGNPLTIAAFAI